MDRQWDTACSFDSAYTAARIHAMRAKLIREYEKLLKMSDKEVITFLESTDYRKDVEGLEIKNFYSLDVIDRILANNEDRTITKLTRIASREFMEVLEGVLEENDKWNIMIIAEAIAGQQDVEEALGRYQRRGRLDLGAFKEAEDLDALARITHAHFGDVPERTEDLSSFLHSLSVSGKGLHPYLIDEKNILAIIRAKREQTQAELIKGGTVSRAVLNDANMASDMRESLRIMQKTPYGDVIRKALERDRMVGFEKRLHAAVTRRIRNSTRQDPLGADVMQHYLAEKDIEHQNIRLLIKSKRLGLSDGFVREHLIT